MVAPTCGTGTGLSLLTALRVAGFVFGAIMASHFVAERRREHKQEVDTLSKQLAESQQKAAVAEKKAVVAAAPAPGSPSTGRKTNHFDFIRRPKALTHA